MAKILTQDVTSFKFADNETDLSFRALQNGVIISDTTLSPTIKIKQVDVGYLKSVSAKWVNNHIVISSGDLSDLPVGSYLLELWLNSSSGYDIYPDSGFVKLSINQNATSISGNLISSITLGEFQQQFSDLAKELIDNLPEGKVGPKGEKGETGPQGIQGEKGERGDQGEQGVAGKDFSIAKTFSSVASMSGDGLTKGDFVMISSTVEDPDNAKLYLWNGTEFTFITDMSGATGVDYNVDGIRKYTPSKTSGSVNPFDGTITSTTSVVYYMVDVTNIDKLTFLSESFSSNYGYAFYDANGVFIPGSGLLEKSAGYATVDVPVMATTFKVTSRLETNQLVTLYYKNASVEVNSDTTELLKTTVYGNKKNLKSRYYQHDTKLISTTTGKYVKVSNSSSILIPVSELGKAIKITGNTTNSSNYTFLKTLNGVVGDTPDYVTGYTGTIPLSLGETKVIKVPSTAGYLFVSNTFDNGQIKQTYPSVISPLKDTEVTLAASNSSDLDKSRADFIGTGTNDELMFNNAITALVYGGTIKLLDGDYYIDSFSYHNNSAVYFENNGYARTINFEGSTENKSFLSDYGVSIHVTKTAFDSTVSGKDYNVFVGSETTIPIGDWQGLPNNVNFKNFYLFFDTSQKQMVGINGQYFGSMYIEQVGVYSKSYFDDRFNHRKPVTPAINSIGVISVGGANDEMARIGMDTVNVGGLGTGIIVARAEHLIMRNSTVSRCVIGYRFIGNSDKPLTLINNADEGNTHLPQFKGRGLITSIDFSIERLDAGPIPDDPTGNTNPFAAEVTPGAWKGFFDYNIQGSALGIRNFWSPESGKNIKTRNINSDKFGTTNPANPDYLQEFFRADLNKKVIYNGSGWYDSAGNVVS